MQSYLAIFLKLKILQKQIDWIKGYKEREARGEEYYFITLDEMENDLA